MSNPNKYLHPKSLIALIAAGSIACGPGSGEVPPDPDSKIATESRSFDEPKCVGIGAAMSTKDPQTFHLSPYVVDADLFNGYGVEAAIFKFGDEIDDKISIDNMALRQSHTYAGGKTYTVEAFVTIGDDAITPSVNKTKEIECPPLKISVPSE